MGTTGETESTHGLVQGLSAQGWVELFARWWAAWADRTGTLGAVGGMGLLSCLLCNVSLPLSSSSLCSLARLPHTQC